MNPLGPILVACVVCVTLTFLFMLCILRMCLKHFIKSRENDDDFQR